MHFEFRVQDLTELHHWFNVMFTYQMTVCGWKAEASMDQNRWLAHGFPLL